MSGDDGHHLPPLPTFANLGVTPPDNLDAEAIGRDWVAYASQCIAQNNIDEIISSVLHADPWWRDVFALTWDLRSFHGRANIQKFLIDRLSESGFGELEFTKAVYQPVFPDLAWILVHFTFTTHVATGKGVARLVYGSEGRRWRAAVVSTHLDGLKGHPELSGDQRDFRLNQAGWQARRQQEQEFAEKDPEVLIIGGGHSGLEVAARLKHLGVSHLVVEKNARIGDNWRNRYNSLTLHDPIWVNHMPYLAYPKSWPVFIPAQKMANWLEFYVDTLELNVWVSSEAVHAARNEQTNKWIIVVRRADGTERTMHVDHVVLAQGFTFKKTLFPGQENFKGQIMHSTDFKSSKGFGGKKVVVIGACTSAHDISLDCADNNVDVTMIQRSSTYILSIIPTGTTLLSASEWENNPRDEVELNNQSLPIAFLDSIAERFAAFGRTLDKDILDGLTKVGYTLTNGKDDCGVYRLFFTRGGGYYLDNGACSKIIAGKIKVKSGSGVDRFTETGVTLTDGSELPADIVVVATGFDDIRVPIRKLLGEEAGAEVPPVWGLNNEGELKAVWRDFEGMPNMWVMMGNFAFCHYYSKMLALQIKAKQAGLYGLRYAAPVS